METWKPVVGFESHYAISSEGRLKRTKLYKSPRKDQPAKTQLKIHKPRYTTAGYAAYCLCVNGVVVQRLAHRLVAEAFLGPIPKGTEVNHKNAKKGDNRVENLEYLSRRDNLMHALSFGIGRWCKKIA
jgi:hypothetical protein